MNNLPKNSRDLIQSSEKLVKHLKEFKTKSEVIIFHEASHKKFNVPDKLLTKDWDE